VVRNGEVLMAHHDTLIEADDIVVVTTKGMVIRQNASDVRIAGRNTQGVRLIKLDAADKVADVAVVVGVEEEERKIALESDKLVSGPPPDREKDNKAQTEKKKDEPAPKKRSPATKASPRKKPGKKKGKRKQ